MLMTGYYPLAAEAQKLGTLLLKPVRSMELLEELTRMLTVQRACMTQSSAIELA